MDIIFLLPLENFVTLGWLDFFNLKLSGDHITESKLTLLAT